MTFDTWPLWKRAITINVLGLGGVGMGFASSDIKLSPELCTPVLVFTLALLNFLMLEVRPHMLVNRALGRRNSFSEAAITSVHERPLVLLLLINQLIAVSQLLTIAIAVVQLLISGRVHSLPNASTVNVGMLPISAAVMTGVAAIWLTSAVGLWRGRSWAWWLALFLNGLAVFVFLGMKLLVLILHKQQSLSFGWRELMASAACIILLLPGVRNDFRPQKPEFAGL